MPTLADLAPRFALLRAVILLSGLLAGCLASPSAVAAAASPAPSWSVVVSSYPTVFAPNTVGTENRPPGYLVVATNLGGAATSGEFTLVDTLPAGLSLSTPEGGYGSYGSQQHPLECAASGQTVSCSGGEPALQPGEVVRLSIPVAVAGGSLSGVHNEVTVSGGGAVPVGSATDTPIGAAAPPFAFLFGEAGLHGSIVDADGSIASLAGSHPYGFSAGLGFPTTFQAGELLAAGGGVRDLAIELPRGMAVDPSAMPTRCAESELESSSGCPDATQVGVLALALSTGSGSPVVNSAAIYQMVPPPGTPVELAFEVDEGAYVHLLGRLRSDGDYGLSTDIHDILAKTPLLGAEVTLWGNPSDESHDRVRGDCVRQGGSCPVERTGAALLALPGSCGRAIATGVRADSWLEPGVFDERQIESPPVDGCNALEFEPSFSLRPTTNRADSPAGLAVDLHVPQSNDFDGLASANLRDVEIALPQGLTVNAAVADGLGSCPRGGASTACPDASKLGTAEIETPPIDHPLPGAVYLAKPYENPFGSLLAIYVAIDDPVSGIVAKLAGRVEADPGNGRLTVHLDAVPELPIEDVRLDFFGGRRSLLKTPIGCGTYAISTRLTPWSSPEGADATPADSFTIDSAADGAGACPASEAAAPNQPGFSAGSTSSQAGAYRPFVLRLSRADGSQRLAALEATLPSGLTGKLAGVPFCSKAAIAAASCPAASEVGTVDVAAGTGVAPLHLGGQAYLAGPYKGAPLSLAVLTPARAGPFDLGTIAVRVALYVDPRSAQVQAVSDPLPTILEGIPLDLRSLAIELDRPDFIRNPSSCEPMAVGAVATSRVGQRAPLAEHFQVGGCPRLGFEPRVAVRLLGSTHRGAHPRLRTVLTARPGDANIRRVGVTLPGTELLDSRRIGAICTKAQFAAEECPPSSIYGHAKVWTPLLDQPLQGPVYLRSSETRLPDLAAALGGQIQLDLLGRVDSVRGHLRNTFQALPDAPLSKVVLTMRGGKRGLLVNTGGVCARERRVSVAFLGQNGKVHSIGPAVKADCQG